MKRASKSWFLLGSGAHELANELVGMCCQLSERNSVHGRPRRCFAELFLRPSSRSEDGKVTKIEMGFLQRHGPGNLESGCGAGTV